MGLHSTDENRCELNFSQELILDHQLYLEFQIGQGGDQEGRPDIVVVVKLVAEVDNPLDEVRPLGLAAEVDEPVGIQNVLEWISSFSEL